MTMNPVMFYVEGEMPGGQKAGRLEYVHDIFEFEKFNGLMNSIRKHENNAWPVTKYTGYFRPGDLYGKDHGHDLVKEFDSKYVPHVDPGIYKITTMMRLVVSVGGIENYSLKAPEEYLEEWKRMSGYDGVV